MTIEGVDFSAARPGGSALAAAGKQFVVRYLWNPSSGGLSNAEIADYIAHGIGVAVVMEQNPGDALTGFATGVAHGQLAQSRLSALKLDPSLPIYFAVDTDTSWAAVSEYFRGVASVIGAARTGVYGGIRVIQGAQGSASVSWFWQTYAWSGGQTASGIHLKQWSNGQSINGGSVDFCTAYTDNYGQLPAGSNPKSQGEIDVQLSDQVHITNADGSAGTASFEAILGALLKNSQTSVTEAGEILQVPRHDGVQSLSAVLDGILTAAQTTDSRLATVEASLAVLAAK